MLTLIGKNIALRALEPEDLDFLFQIENNEEFWEVSNTQAPFSKFVLKKYLENSHRDIYEVKQLRLVICNKKGGSLGLIDVFDFDPKNRHAGIGIVIGKKENRGKGYGKEALELLCDYCFSHLNLHQVYANISEENKKSQHLFEDLGFEKIGLKKEWNLVGGNFKNEFLYQLINNVH
ncbi:MAG TPA: GNAT family N-acetyltransferase [Flavobacteriaceae bacterium]|nr:GNAT family N-acetyltransferase [Flavobacteriaceae bacterium]